MTKILYCFISHKNKILEDIYSISTMMNGLNHKDYIIFYGGKDKITNNQNTVYVDVDDSWCGLPEKINSMYKYVTNNYSNYDYYVKLDRTVVVKKILEKEDIVDYGGFIHHFNPSVNPKWKQYHLGKCGNESPWNDKEFDAPELKFCSGVAYMLSNQNANFIAKDNSIYKNHIYEDYYVGTILKDNGILAKYLSIKKYYFDNDHKWMFR